MLIVSNYHYIRADYSACSGGIHGVTPAEFESQLALLGRQGTFVSASDILAAVTGGSELAARSLLVTFDDGLREQFELALPILNRMGIPAIFFVNTRPIVDQCVCTVHKVHLMRALVPPAEFQSALEEGARNRGIDLNYSADPQKAAVQYPYDTLAAAKLKFLINFTLPLAERIEVVNATFAKLFPGRERKMSRELYMSRSQIATLMQAGYLGTHGHDHHPIGQLDDNFARDMIARSSDHLNRWTGLRPFTLSYPYGVEDTCSRRTAELAEERGIKFGFTVESAGNDAGSLRNPHFLGRFDCNLLPGGKQPRFISADTLFEEVPAARWHRVENPEEENELTASFAANG
jgi:peptidoglycan/xylan/chitin deacetylase (PgdA/CDA1 family)